MGIFREWIARRILIEKKKVDIPDYSFDRWLKSVQQLGSQVDSLVGQAKEKEAEADKELDKKKKELPKEKPEEEDKPQFDKDAWHKLKKIAKERERKDSADGKDDSRKNSRLLGKRGSGDRQQGN